MIIKGEYRDVLQVRGKPPEDRGWTSNSITDDYGKFLAALMKKSFPGKVGIEYMAVGNGSSGWEDFREKIKSFLRLGSIETPFIDGDNWVWVKKIGAEEMKFLDSDDVESDNVISNKLRINVAFAENEPSSTDTLIFGEFALFGIEETLDINKMFLVNYVSHGPITKDNNMNLTRTVRLSFPISMAEEGML